MRGNIPSFHPAAAVGQATGRCWCIKYFDCFFSLWGCVDDGFAVWAPAGLAYSCLKPLSQRVELHVSHVDLAHETGNGLSTEVRSC